MTNTVVPIVAHEVGPGVLQGNKKRLTRRMVFGNGIDNDREETRNHVVVTSIVLWRKCRSKEKIANPDGVSNSSLHAPEIFFLFIAGK